MVYYGTVGNYRKTGEKEEKEMQNTLGGLIEALQQAVDRAQEQLQSYQLRMLSEYFDGENQPLYVKLRLPRIPAGGGPLEHIEVEVPRISLVQMGTVTLDELEMDFPLRMQELSEDERQLLVDLPGSALSDEGCARVKIRFKGGEPPEAVMKLNDTLLKVIP